MGRSAACSVVLLLLALQAAATAAPVPAGASGGYSLVPDAFVYCTTCHGVELRGNVAVDAPRLNGMEGWYVRRQLLAFKRGHRGTHPEDAVGRSMQPQAAILTDRELEEAVAFVTRIPLRAHTIEHTVTGDVTRGKRLYSHCAACHGGDGQGNRALGAPRLAGQSDWYLARQLQNYLSGTRGYAGTDRGGRQMRAAAAVLARPADVRDVVAYINTLPVR